MSEIRLKYVIAESVNAQNARAVRRHYLPNEGAWNAVTLVAVFGGLLGPPLSRALTGQEIKAFFVLVALGFALFVYRAVIRGRRFRDAIIDAPMRQGFTELTLDETGVHTRHPGAEMRYFWSHVSTALATKNAVLILTSPAEYLPIPIEALPPGETPDSVAETVRGWIAKAQGEDAAPRQAPL